MRCGTLSQAREPLLQQVPVTYSTNGKRPKGQLPDAGALPIWPGGAQPSGSMDFRYGTKDANCHVK